MKLVIQKINHSKNIEITYDEILNIRSEEYDIDLDKYECKNEFEVLFSRTRNFPISEDVPKNND